MLENSLRLVYNEDELPNEINLSIFSQQGYLSSKSSVYGWVVSSNFILPFFVDRRLIFRRLIFTTEPIAISQTCSDYSVFLNEAIDIIGKKRLCDFISKAQSNVVFSAIPAGASVAPWGTYFLDIEKSQEDLLAGYHQKHRNVIRKAIKDNVSISFNESADVVYENIKETLLRQKKPYYPAKHFIQELQTNLKEKVILASASHDGVLQGVAIVLHDGNTAYYLYGGSIARPHSGSLNLMQHELFCLLQQRGVKKYDFVGARINVASGSKYEGIQRFKKRFGSVLREGYTFRYVYSKPKFFLFNLAVKGYLKMKGMTYQDPIAELIQG